MVLFLLAVAAAAPPPAPGPLRLATSVAVERPAGPDGAPRPVTGRRARPGDRLVVTLAYRNAGPAPLADLVLADPVPAQLAFQAAAAGSPTPEVSVDGARFGALAALAVPLPGGGTRPAGPDDVRAVRWRLERPLAPGAGGSLAYRAVLR